MNISQLVEIENKIKIETKKIKQFTQNNKISLDSKIKKLNIIFWSIWLMILISCFLGISPIIVIIANLVNIIITESLKNLYIIDSNLVHKKNINDLDLIDKQLDAIDSFKQYLKGMELSKEQLISISKFLIPILPKQDNATISELICKDNSLTVKDEYFLKLEQLKSLFSYFDNYNDKIYFEHLDLITTFEIFGNLEHTDEELKDKITIIDQNIEKYQENLNDGPKLNKSKEDLTC